MNFNHRVSIQEALIWNAGYLGLLDGDFGARTISSIASWQQENGYKPDGELTFDQETILYEKLNQYKKIVGWKSFTSVSDFYTISYPSVIAASITDNESSNAKEFYGDSFALRTFFRDFMGTAVVSALSQAVLELLKEGNDSVEDLYQKDTDDWAVVSAELNGNELFYFRAFTKGRFATGFTVRVLFNGEEEKRFGRALITAIANSFKVDWRYALDYQLARLPIEDEGKSVASSRSLESVDESGVTVYSSSIPDVLNKALPRPSLGVSNKEGLSAKDVFKKVKNSIWVLISGDGNDVSQGSAVAVHKNYLLTNCHVLNDRVSFIVNQSVGSEPIRVSLHTANKSADRCTLFSEKDLPSHVTIRPYLDVEVGEEVFSIGTPQGLDLTIAEGLLSSKRTMDNTRYLQTSAPISSGSSGGGLFDAYGNLLGITTMMLRESQNLNFAIPVDDFWNGQ